MTEGGVYMLPDGRKFIVRASGKDEYSLFPLQALDKHCTAEYRIAANGRILSKGIPTRWCKEDLTDTGRIIKDGTPAPKGVLKRSNQEARGSDE